MSPHDNRVSPCLPRSQPLASARSWSGTPGPCDVVSLALLSVDLALQVGRATPDG